MMKLVPVEGRAPRGASTRNVQLQHRDVFVLDWAANFKWQHSIERVRVGDKPLLRFGCTFRSIASFVLPGTGTEITSDGQRPTYGRLLAGGKLTTIYEPNKRARVDDGEQEQGPARKRARLSVF
jgi:hypothetical protein